MLIFWTDTVDATKENGEEKVDDEKQDDDKKTEARRATA